ncbi:hypothetical protein BUALT_Bualt13G0106100 [Buddleja alternifolia]|uniref:ATP-dependent DNA helicase n=1 Tax=Buddleja alternifolia TaxID=168488 RepID=A0AAV6WLN1_9LAMI|nr:hypothetical protein BUALT_Bualt13G0106100 [Buddleja alternifolia]
MQDQVMALKQRGIRAEYFSSAQTNVNVHRNAESGQYDILYMTPEKACLLATSFWSRLLESGICLLAVDEAHCISEWGHSFRVEYKQLDKLRNVLPNVPFVGLTATATEKVRNDIVNSLKMKDPHVTVGSFDRQNLFYSVKSVDRSNAFMNELVQEIGSYVEKAGSTIIYCTTVKDVEQVSMCLGKAGIENGMYHGQMSNKAREESHRSFIRDEFYVMVATVAFGMGIDKPNIRYVIHYGCPKSLESYYQESGRCGRDGIPSICRLYYARSDFAKAEFYCADAHTCIYDVNQAGQRKAIMESLMAAQRYCVLTTCRRKFLLEYFGEKHSSVSCGTCDNCTSSKKKTDMSREAFLLIACLHSCGGNWGLNLPIDVLRGSRSKKIVEAQFDKLPFHGLGKEFSANFWKALAYQLISLDYLIETFKDVYKFVRVGTKGMQFLNSCSPDHQPPLYLLFTPEMTGEDVNKDTIGEVEGVNGLTQLGFDKLSEAEDKLYKMLVEERMKLARDSGTAPYALCGDQTLRRIALTRPSTRARLANIDGVNQHFLIRYGDHLLQAIQRLSHELTLCLDGELNTVSQMPRRLLTLPKNNGLTPAKFEAWKMWQENGLTLQKIANHPSRAAPIKEQTVFKYILEAGKEGCEIDWTRLRVEIGLTEELFKTIQDVVSKVGKEKLKPIKNELPEEVSYIQIEGFLVVHEMGMSADIPSGSQHGCKVDNQSPNVTSKLSEGSINLCHMDVDQRNLVSVDDLTSSTKRQKLEELQVQQSVAMEATEDSVLSWLKNFDDGVSLSEMLVYFKGSKEESVIELLKHLEGEFLVFKKNNRYKLV